MVVAVSESPKHLLIDGSNVGRAWPELARLWRHSADAAQRRLVESVQVWHDVMGWRVTVVFDGRGVEVAVDLPSGEASYVVAYSPSHATADTVIEQWVAGSRDPASCVVATCDAGLAETVRASGGTVISPAELREWVSRAELTAARRTAQLRRQGREAR